MIAGLTVVAALLLTPPPDFVARTTGAELQALLSPGYRVAQTHKVDMDGDGRLEQVGLVVAERAGATRVAGLVVCAAKERPRTLHVLAGIETEYGIGYDDVSISVENVDLDGDGAHELSLDERVSGPGGLLLRARTFWHLADGTLHRVFHITQHYRFRGRTEERSFRADGKGSLRESVVVREGKKTRRRQLNYRWIARMRRFAPGIRRVLP